ncbi:hypothetical protein CIG75_09505 [Tumebacillus algifaecis]|uniref:Uncharacterized protein n=1 Tax=Tumebacillus algifaecis TaxID=1214604 RepID=A0A223D132_9BACL|nr:hypothetical protein [Tumebacillus algifaecis]ASS75195.1 hypothetical protein CIG75_09505 [Tumebacillus algifaecis]
MKIKLMTPYERHNWECYSRTKVRIGNQIGCRFIHQKHRDRWYFRGYRVEADGFYEAMTKLEERIFGVEGLSDRALWERVGAMIGVNGIWGYLYKSKTKQGTWVWCGHEFEAETEKKAREHLQSLSKDS